MIKTLVINFIVIYQKFISLPLKMIMGQPKFCYQVPTCSEYTKQAVIREGVILGLFLGAKRISGCRPQFI